MTLTYSIHGNSNGDGSPNYAVLAPDPDRSGDTIVLAENLTERHAALFASAPELLAELAETATWLEERATVLERHYGSSLEVTRLRGRAELIRFRLVNLGVA